VRPDESLWRGRELSYGNLLQGHAHLSALSDVREVPVKLAILLSAALWTASCPISWPKPKPSPSPSPSPTPKPSPSPSASPGYQCKVDPETKNYPVPPGTSCPSPCWDESLGWTGISFTGKTPVDPQGGKYLGWRFNFGSTPHSKPPYCGHAPGIKCEQWKPLGGGCQDGNGPDFWMKREGGWPSGGPEWQECDKFSANPWACHHKARAEETGLTTVCAVPAGASIDDPRGRCVTIDVQK
jgi:hypothetical protein